MAIKKFKFQDGHGYGYGDSYGFGCGDGQGGRPNQPEITEYEVFDGVI